MDVMYSQLSREARIVEGLRLMMGWLKDRNKKSFSEKGLSQNKIVWEELPATLDVALMAKVLKITPSKGYGLCKQEGFPAAKIGKRILISRDRLKKWVEKNQFKAN